MPWWGWVLTWWPAVALAVALLLGAVIRLGRG